MSLNLESIVKPTLPSSSSSAQKDAFRQMMKGKRPAELAVLRDTCSRPEPIYNEYYDPYKPPPADLPARYTPYEPGQPLWDDRALVLA
jgi:hypothetical protein